MRSFLVSLVLGASSFIACGPPPGGFYGPPGGPSPASHDDPAVAGPGKQCDPKRCEDFCWRAGCLYGAMEVDRCKAACNNGCGNGFFDDQDAAVINCTDATDMSIECRGMRDCCDAQINNEICPD